MLDQLLIHQVRRRLKASGLPLAVELWNGELLEPSTLAAVRIRLHHMASLKALAYPNLGAWRGLMLRARWTWKAVPGTFSRWVIACAMQAVFPRRRVRKTRHIAAESIK